MRTKINMVSNYQPSRSVRCLILWVFAVMMVSCNDSLEVGITPEGSRPQDMNYNTAECTYYGDLIGNGVAFFRLNLYNTSNPNVGLFMMGFCTLPNSFANFKLDTGTYQLSENGTVRTFFPGMLEGETFIGTFLYNFTTNKITYITGGTMTVSQSGDTYTFDCAFACKDAVTGASEEDVRIRFSGSVDFFSSDPVKSSYTATGTPAWKEPPGAGTWSGTFEPFESGNEKWYEITNWGNENITVYFDKIDGAIMIDDYTPVYSDNSHDAYFRVGFIDREANTLFIFESYDYIVQYDLYTGLLDCSGTVTHNGKDYQALIGVIGYNKSGDPEKLFSDFYANAKLQLNPVSTSTRSTILRSNSVADALKNTHVTQRASKLVTDRQPTIIVVNDSNKSTIQKIQLKD